MKKTLALISAIALVLMANTNVIYAGQITPTVSVTGALSTTCKAGTTGSLAFTIDPSLAGPIAATVTNATVLCSKGAPFTVTAASANKGGAPASCAGPGGITGTLKTGTSTMDYAFTCNVNGSGGNTGSGNGLGSGMDVNLGIAASITAASYQNAPVSSSYADTVTLTITY